MNRKFWIALALGLLVCLGIGYAWTARLDIPNPKPWWYGRSTVVRVEVWEPGKEMATVGVTMPKKALDYMHALNLKSEIGLDHGYRVNIDELWSKIQRLPKGQRLHLSEEEADVYVWIEEKGTPTDSTWRPPMDSTKGADF
ncbi:MAG TPA: hypothetical protein VFY90_06855 [Tepidiformaceae bacterium]|jgi:hypothetical protein|nr:hypothetical protein [Candidatus Eisenbacteria bacterium]HEX6031132.1 hypothetical protein [Tepidiformaceae bacterium]